MLNCTRHLRAFILAGSLLAATLAAASDTSATQRGTSVILQKLEGVARITFQGTSTLHDFEGRVMSEPFELNLSPNSWSAKASVLGSDMTTSNNKRDKNMWALLATNLHPRLHGEVINAPRPPAPGTNILMAFTIRDKTIDVPVSVSNWSETADAVRFRADWVVSLKAYGLKAPSVAGFIKVGDTVRVQANVAVTNRTALQKSAD